MNTAPESPDVAQAFTNLEAARESLSAAEFTRKLHVNRLRRFARKHNLTTRQARNYVRIHMEADYYALIRAELAHGTARRKFRSAAMVAAITRLVDTDRQLRSQQAA